MVGFFTLNWEVSRLISEKNRISNTLFQMKNRISKLRAYAAIIGTGSISIGAMLSAPAGYGQKLMSYLNYAHTNAMQYVQQNTPTMMQMYFQNQANATASGQAPDPVQQQKQQAWIQNMLYQQERDRIKELERNRLMEIEHRMTQEKDRLEQELAMVKQELSDAKSGRESARSEMNVKYT